MGLSHFYLYPCTNMPEKYHQSPWARLLYPRVQGRWTGSWNRQTGHSSLSAKSSITRAEWNNSQSSSSELLGVQRAQEIEPSVHINDLPTTCVALCCLRGCTQAKPVPQSLPSGQTPELDRQHACVHATIQFSKCCDLWSRGESRQNSACHSQRRLSKEGDPGAECGIRTKVRLTLSHTKKHLRSA